jgi:hypothetical protein
MVLSGPNVAIPPEVQALINRVASQGATGKLTLNIKCGEISGGNWAESFDVKKGTQVGSN